MEAFHFFFEDVPSFDLDKDSIKEWIKECAKNEKQLIKELTLIFCSDEYLLKINQDYLSHDYFTDIITFDLSEGDPIEGELYLSIDRIRDNSQKVNATFNHELHRVIIHGALHLMGYGDKTPEEQIMMRQKEDQYLSLLNY